MLPKSPSLKNFKKLNAKPSVQSNNSGMLPCMTTMYENIHRMKLTYLLSFVSLNLRGPFCTFTLTLTLLIAF